jgi:peptidoglycan glycosyltransferase
MAAAYATLAASGVRHEPFFVQRVVDSAGKVLLDRGAGTKGEQKVSKPIADTVTQAMVPIAAYSRGHALSGGRSSAAKTGTTELSGNDNKDAWMVGFTPSLSTAVWIGTERGTAIRSANGADLYGSGFPADIWKLTMDGALTGRPNEKLPVNSAAMTQTQTGPGPAPSGGDIIIPPSGPPRPIIPG